MFDKKRKLGKILAAAAAVAGTLRGVVIPIIRSMGGWFGRKKRTYAKLVMRKKTEPIRLYKCPACQREFQINSSGERIWCGDCGKEWLLFGGGKVRAKEGKAEFSTLSAWQDWEHECIREEIRNGTYRFEDTVRVETRAGTGAFVRQGAGRLLQSAKGTVLECRYYGEEYTLLRSARTLEQMKILYNPHGTGDCIELPAQSGCFRCYLSKRNVLPKLAFATEEIHRQASGRS